MRRLTATGALPALATLAALALFTGCAGRTADTACGGEATYADIAVAEGIGLCSTASEAEHGTIDLLVQGGNDGSQPAGLVVDYPIEGSVIPPEIAPPTFLWHDDADGADAWLLDAAFADGSARLSVLVPGEPAPKGEIDPQCISKTNKIYEPTPYQASAISWKPSAEVW